MQFSLTHKYLFAALAALIITLLIVLSFEFNWKTANASAPTGLQATVATTSNPTVTINTSQLLIATSSCSARIISTASTSLMLTFSDNQGQSPTASFGVWQAASTSVAYDSGQYGCGAVKGYSFATGVITVSDVR